MVENIVVTIMLVLYLELFELKLIFEQIYKIFFRFGKLN